jgi:phospholipid transport system substrate-binding protein
LTTINNIKFVFCLVTLCFGGFSSMSVMATEEVSGQLEQQLTNKELISAKDVVTSFQQVLIDTMKQGEDVSFKERCKVLKKAILSSHDVLKSLRTIVGSRQWKQFADEQQDQLTDVFTDFIVSTYAFNFNGYSNESFVYESEHTTRKGNIVVRSILNLPENKRKKVTFDYALKKNSTGWQIFNIAADGVSDLATRRSEYRRILSGEDGFNTLIAIINKKIDNYANNN